MGAAPYEAARVQVTTVRYYLSLVINIYINIYIYLSE